MVGHSSSARLQIPGIHTEPDAGHIIHELLALDGIQEASIDLLQKSVYVRFDPDRITMYEIKEALRHFGHEFQVIWEHV
jgi:copper chaperone CopZ